DAPPATAEEEYAQRLAELDFHSVLADLCPNPVLGLFCRFLQTLLRETVVCRRIYDTPHPVLRDTAIHYQIRLLRALRAGDSAAAREIMAGHMAAAQEYMVRMEASIAGRFLRVQDSPGWRGGAVRSPARADFSARAIGAGDHLRTGQSEFATPFSRNSPSGRHNVVTG